MSEPTRRNRRALPRVLATFGPLVGLVATWSLFALLSGADFVAWSNQRLMLEQTAVVGVAAVGATAIIVAGGIDLSVGSTIALGTVVGALVLRAGGATLHAVLATIATGLAVGAATGTLVVGRWARVAGPALGAWIGVLVAPHQGPWIALGVGAVTALVVGVVGERITPRLPLSPFIVTLGLWGALRGLAKGLGDNQPVYPPSVGGLDALTRPAESGLAALAAPSVWILAGLALAMALVLRYTRFGRNVFALGSNEETARLCGVRVERTKVWVYVIAVGCAGVAAVLQLGYLSMGDPTTASGHELKVIAACVIGGASLSGGQGSVLGTFVGALIMTVVDNGCTKLGLDNWVQEIATGAIIVAAVALDRWRARSAD
ncbi:MAG: ABC transporter permease [Planctomycetes bacterium]|nr:ABC transporter permease [Planctomycetota bacterium]